MQLWPLYLKFVFFKECLISLIESSSLNSLIYQLKILNLLCLLLGTVSGIKLNKYTELTCFSFAFELIKKLMLFKRVLKKGTNTANNCLNIKKYKRT